MKKFTVLAAMLLVAIAFSNKTFAQQNRSDLSVLPNFTGASPIQFTDEIFRFKTGLATHYFAGNLPGGTPTLFTGFEAADKWLSFGKVRTGTQDIYGFRTQINGRGLATGYSIPSLGSVSDPFVEWIGNDNISIPNPAVIAPGNLNFRYALNPTSATRVPIFTMAPASGTTPSFNYAEKDAFVGQLQRGAFGSFGTGDTWSAIGQITPPSSSLTSYGSRHQYEGYTVNTGILRNGGAGTINAIMDFGNDAAGLGSYVFQFRSFTDPTNPGSIRNVWQSSNKLNNMVLGVQDYFTVLQSHFQLGVFDGVASNTSSTGFNFVEKAGLYVTGDGFDQNASGLQLGSYAAVVGDVSGVSLSGSSTQKYAILGIADASYIPGPYPSSNNKWAGYFIGEVGYTGSLTAVSDQKFKTSINTEENIMPRLMQLQPKNYLFDIEKYKNMAFSNKLQHGLISQEVEKVFPELVTDAFAPNTSSDKKEDGKPIPYKGLNYMGLITMLLKGIQEQEAKIEKLETQLETVTSNTLVVTDKNSLPAEIQNKAFALSQNNPNPFSDNTTISYTIPANTGKAILAIFDLTGKMLKEYPLTSGKNTIVVQGNTLSAGMYLYSLIADGQEVLSKRMVLTK